MTLTTTLRHADATTLLNTLNDLEARKVDVVHPASQVRVVNGQLVLTDVMTEEGTWQRMTLDLSDTFLQGLSTKLNVPIAYLRRCLVDSSVRNANAIVVADAVKYDREPIFDQTINRWMVEQAGSNVLVRAYAGDAGTGLARAFLSDQFLTFDNIDMATAVFTAVQEAGVNAQLIGADLSDDHMWLNFRCPDVTADGGEFVRSWKFRGDHDRQVGDVVEAGFMVRNSETGHGKAVVIPRVLVLKCLNGMTQNLADTAKGRVHIGARQAQGVNWSRATTDARVDLIKAEMGDVVRQCTTVEYIEGVMDRINAVANVELERPVKAVDHVVKMFNMTEERREALFASFVAGGAMTVGGIVQAMTDVANGLGNVEDAHELEFQAEKLLAGSTPRVLVSA